MVAGVGTGERGRGCRMAAAALAPVGGGRRGGRRSVPGGARPLAPLATPGPLRCARGADRDDRRHAGTLDGDRDPVGGAARAAGRGRVQTVGRRPAPSLAPGRPTRPIRPGRAARRSGRRAPVDRTVGADGRDRGQRRAVRSRGRSVGLGRPPPSPTGRRRRLARRAGHWILRRARGAAPLRRRAHRRGRCAGVGPSRGPRPRSQSRGAVSREHRGRARSVPSRHRAGQRGRLRLRRADHRGAPPALQRSTDPAGAGHRQATRVRRWEPPRDLDDPDRRGADALLHHVPCPALRGSCGTPVGRGARPGRWRAPAPAVLLSGNLFPPLARTALGIRRRAGARGCLAHHRGRVALAAAAPSPLVRGRPRIAAAPRRSLSHQQPGSRDHPAGGRRVRAALARLALCHPALVHGPDPAHGSAVPWVRCRERPGGVDRGRSRDRVGGDDDRRAGLEPARRVAGLVHVPVDAGAVPRGDARPAVGRDQRHRPGGRQRRCARYLGRRAQRADPGRRARHRAARRRARPPGRSAAGALRRAGDGCTGAGLGHGDVRAVARLRPGRSRLPIAVGALDQQRLADRRAGARLARSAAVASVHHGARARSG